MQNLKTALCAAAVLCAPMAAQAATTYYTDLGAFQAAAGATGFESFEHPLSASAAAVATADVTVSCATGVDCIVPAYPVPTDGDISIGSYNALSFTFASPIRAFGIDAIGLGSAGIQADFLVQVGSAPPVTLYTNQFNAYYVPLFVGLVSDTPFSQVTLYGTDVADFVAYDSLRFGPGPSLTSAAPEPTAWALLLLGFGGAGAMLRQRRRVSAG